MDIVKLEMRLAGVSERGGGSACGVEGMCSGIVAAGTFWNASNRFESLGEGGDCDSEVHVHAWKLMCTVLNVTVTKGKSDGSYIAASMFIIVAR